MLFSLTADYTPAALRAMRENPDTGNRQDAVSKLVEAAGGKLVAMYFRIHDGPGAQAIFDLPIRAWSPPSPASSFSLNASRTSRWTVFIHRRRSWPSGRSRDSFTVPIDRPVNRARRTASAVLRLRSI